MAVPDESLRAIADEVFGLMAAPREIAPFTDRIPGYGLDDAYRVVETLRRRRVARGERVVGRKIGFTNRTAWAGYGITGPICNYLYDTTTPDLASVKTFALGAWPNIRMEMEIALGLGTSPRPGMDDAALLECVDWIALDFEICTSAFPDWRFAVADAAATGVHVALLVGPRLQLTGDRARWAADLSSFSAKLSEAAGATATGGGAQVLGSPISALGALTREMARIGAEPMAPGDVVTTGTLTRALPATAGQRWRAEVEGLPLEPIEIALA
jgi:2-keto-4-pentenoate hydratase